MAAMVEATSFWIKATPDEEVTLVNITLCLLDSFLFLLRATGEASGVLTGTLSIKSSGSATTVTSFLSLSLLDFVVLGSF